jgi:hypothetical protein
MKIVAICLAVPLVVAGADVLAQATGNALAQATGDAMEKLRACSVLASAERRDCLEKLSRDIGAPPPNAAAAPPAREVTPVADNWIVSETTSPFDYSPVAVATASATSGQSSGQSSGQGGAPLQLSIQCRGGRTELVIASAALTLRGETYIVSYDIDGGPPVTLATGTPASGAGVAIKGDVVRLLASLPDRGNISFRVAARQGTTMEARYALAGLKAVLKRLAGPCKWPVAGAPRN